MSNICKDYMLSNILYTIMGANHSDCVLHPKQSNLKDLICFLGDLKDFPWLVNVNI